MDTHQAVFSLSWITAVTVIMSVYNSCKHHYVFHVYACTKENQTVNLSKLQFTFTLVPLNPDDLIVPAKSFFAIFLNEDEFFE